MPISLAPPVADFLYITTALYMKQRFGLDFTVNEIESLMSDFDPAVSQEAQDGNYAPWLHALSRKFAGGDWPHKVQGVWVSTFVQALMSWRWGNLQIGDRVRFITHYRATCTRPHGIKDKEYRVRFKNFAGPAEMGIVDTYVELDGFDGKVGLGCIVRS